MAVSEGKPTAQITAFVEGLAFLGGGAFVGVCPLCAGGWWRAGVVPPSLCTGEAGLASPPGGLAVTLWVCPFFVFWACP